MLMRIYYSNQNHYGHETENVIVCCTRPVNTPPGAADVSGVIDHSERNVPSSPGGASCLSKVSSGVSVA